MIQSWVLLILMSTGELQAYPMENELACDRERVEIIALSNRVFTGPTAVVAHCVEALVDHGEVE